jgi:HlyD family secretion protein
MSDHTTSQDVQARLGVTAGGRRHRRIGRWLLALVIAAGLLAATTRAVRTLRATAPVQYQTETVKQGTLTVSVTATGELKSLTEVKVGTEISGIVETVNVDYNTHVEVGQLLAKINTEKMEAQAAQAKASLQSAQADLVNAEAAVDDTRRSLSRAQTLFARALVSRSDQDAAEAAARKADASRESAVARIGQAEANLSAIETDLRKAVIRSPINGIVLDRQVDPGQTVAAAFQTPTLFTLAEDLTRMKLIVDVDEADIGNVRPGQSAHFRVDAYPDKAFESKVKEVRSTPKTSNGVVTYQTVLTVDNSARLLQPGMTATAEITVTQVSDAVLVPNAALRFTPPAALQSGRGFRLLPTPPGLARRDRSADKAPPRVWTLVDQDLTPITVTLGATNGTVTALRGAEVRPGTPVIVDLVAN